MQTIKLSTWEEFEAHVKELRRNDKRDSPLLFRGQGDATWPLTTTLERAGQEKMRFTSYYQVVDRFKPEIEALTGMNWGERPYPDVDRLLRNYGTLMDALQLSDVYRYLVYLRHHGFPSPLLDWTRSPYVAAYFAFTQPAKEPDAQVSIYVFSETPRGFKVTRNDRPRIIRLGPHVRSHRRHFLQQSDYSICALFKKVWRFEAHDEVFSVGASRQDILTKINIPTRERLKVLSLLDEHNLNAFSLFGTEASLMETMAIRALGIGRHGPAEAAV
jgi:hypothetical protein